LLYRRLTRIALDAPVSMAADALAWRGAKGAALEELCELLRFGPLTRQRLKALV
jgi:hypothetical protein